MAMSSNTVEIMNKGMLCLRNQLGTVEAEHFINIVIREQFDYTTWHKTAFSDVTLSEMSDSAVEYEKAHPFAGEHAKTI